MTATEPRPNRDTDSWARPVDRLTTTASGAGTDTVTGKRVAGPIQGFGQMWQKTFSVRLDGVATTPERARRALEGTLPDVLAKGLQLLRALGRHRPGRGRPARGAAPAGFPDQDVDRRHGHLR